MQLDLIAAVRSVAKKVVLVVVSGSAVPFDESAADAAVYAMYARAHFRTRITTCYPDRVEAGPDFAPGLPHVVICTKSRAVRIVPV